MFENREYQNRAVREVREALIKGHKKILLTLATGSGKSIIARDIVSMAEKKNNNVLFLAHRTLLIKQMKEVLDSFDNVVIETIQSSKNRQHDDIKIIIVDEAHYGVNSPMQDKVLLRYKNAVIIGLTATPITHQGHKIEGWDILIDIVQLADLIKMGFASSVRVLAPASVDRSGFNSVANDYNAKDVAKEVTKSTIIKNVVDKYIKYGENRRAIFYCINIDHSELIASELAIHGISASSYHSKIKNKDEIFEDFKSGKLQVLSSVESLTTGVDLPDIYCLVLATPTKSVIKAVQIFGRGTRLDKNNPDKICLILDCAGVIDDTIHPLQRMNFNSEPEQKLKKCVCGGNMAIVKTSMTEPNEYGMYIKTTTRKCSKCGSVKIDEEELLFEITFCEGCEAIIEKGTAVTKTEIKDGFIQLISICPHCENEKIIREVEEIDAELEEKLLEVYVDEVTTWDDLDTELKKAKDKYGKRYHHYWSKRTIEALKEEGFSVIEVKRTIKFYMDKGWNIGGLVTAMKKRRGDMV